MARGTPRRVDALLSQVLGQVAERTGSGAALQRVWLEVVGPAVGKNARPASLWQGVLTVTCDGASWQEALSGQCRELLKKLSERLGPGVVKEIRFTVP